MVQVFSKRQEVLLIVVMLTVTLSSMSILLINFVLPMIQEEFHLNHSQVSWVTSLYTLLYGIGTAIYGKLADRYQLKDILIVGLTVFSIASLIGFFTNSYWMLLIIRFMQSIGAASVPAASTLIPIRYYPEEERGKAMGTVMAGVALGHAFAPVIAALIVSFLDWRWLFIVPLLVVFTFPFYLKLLGEEQVSETKIDWLGGVLLAFFVAQILLGTTLHLGWIIGGIVAAGLFVWRISTAKHPFVQPELFRNKEYSFYLTLAFITTGMGFAIFFTAPLFLSEVYKLKASLIGFVMVPAAVVTALLNRQGGKLADRKGSSFLFFISLALMFIGFLFLSTFMGANLVLIAGLLILGEVGQSFMMIMMSRSISLTLPAEYAGVSMGLLMMQNFLAGSIAIGIYGRVIDIDTNQLWNPLSFSTLAGNAYSNLFFVLAILCVVVLLAFLAHARRRAVRNITEDNDPCIPKGGI